MRSKPRWFSSIQAVQISQLYPCIYCLCQQLHKVFFLFVANSVALRTFLKFVRHVDFGYSFQDSVNLCEQRIQVECKQRYSKHFNIDKCDTRDTFQTSPNSITRIYNVLILFSYANFLCCFAFAQNFAPNHGFNAFNSMRAFHQKNSFHPIFSFRT